MRTIVKILSVAVAAACAVGMSACGSKDGQDASGPASGAGAPTSQASGGSTDSAAQATGQSAVAGAQEIEPITFTDEAIGLTETCDQLISDFDAPQFKELSSSENETIYLLHCTLEFSGNLSFNSATDDTLKLSDDNDKYHNATVRFSGLEDDIKQAGLNPINIDDYGTNHVDGWFALEAWEKGGKPYPLPEGAMTLVYERGALSEKGSGKVYEAYLNRAKVTAKNG